MSIFDSGHWRQHVALDVGTATTRIASSIAPAIEQPSHLGARQALRDGVIVDGETALQILKPLLDRTKVFGIVKPCILTCAPSDASKEERQLLVDAIMNAGAASISVIPEPLAAAIGAGMDVSSPYARMIIDVGEGVTDCAVIRAGKISATCAIRIGCCRMRRAVVTAAQKWGPPRFSDADGDRLMRTCGLARSPDHAGSILTAVALQPVIEEITATIDSFLRSLPDDLGCEVIDNGICLAGGGAQIPGLREYVEQRTGISVSIARNPLTAVVEGARSILPVILALNLWK